jgi:hypothetical protein
LSGNFNSSLWEDSDGLAHGEVVSFGVFFFNIFFSSASLGYPRYKYRDMGQSPTVG